MCGDLFFDMFQCFICYIFFSLFYLFHKIKLLIPPSPQIPKRMIVYSYILIETSRRQYNTIIIIVAARYEIIGVVTHNSRVSRVIHKQK
jgi:hypothetical protein